MSYSDGGKGSSRRKEDVKKIHDNWDLIFGRKEKTMNEHEEQPKHDNDEEEWTCNVCGGPIYAALHWTYGQCDDCGARQELESDF
jgi:rubrerythrin